MINSALPTAGAKHQWSMAIFKCELSSGTYINLIAHIYLCGDIWANICK